MASGYVENTALAILTTSVASRCDDLKLARERMEGDIDSAYCPQYYLDWR